MKFFRDLLRPRFVPDHGQGLYKPVSVATQNAAQFVYEPLTGPAGNPIYRGYFASQPPGGTNGANWLPITGGKYTPLGAGYTVRQTGAANHLVTTGDSLTAQELI